MSRPEDIILAPVPKRLERVPGVFHPSRPLLEAIRHYDSNHGPVPGVHIIVGRSVSERSTSEHGPERVRDSYELLVAADGVTITAPAPQGAFYGMMSLRQILRHVDPDHVPCLHIRDWPDYANRGVMLDISRDRVPTMETLYRMVDLWCELKINQLQLYTEHTFAYSAHRKVWEKASPMTGEQLLALDTYCMARYIELVPNQNSFGHMERWLKHPEYAHLAEAPDGFTGFEGIFQREPFSLSPAVPESVPFLAGLYDDLLPNFTSDKFNVGCDETIDLGQGRSAELCRSRGTGRVYLDFVKQVHELVKGRGRKMLYWGDVILHYPQLIRELPPDAIALTWGYEWDHPFEKECSSFEESGLDYYVCAGTSAWNSIGGRWENARGNLENAAAEGLLHGAIGFLTTEWGDNGHMQQYPVGLPGYLYGAALSWSTAESRGLPVADALSRHVFGDPGGELAGALLELGDATKTLSVRLHNATVLAAALLDPRYPYYRERYPELAGSDFASCREVIERALTRVERSGHGSVDPLLKEEIAHTARVMLHACELAELRFGSGVRSIAELEPRSREHLAEGLEPLIAEYRRLWLARSRPGGLDDSAGRLEELVRLYRGF